MKLSKKKREALRMMFGGRCAYCGHELNSRWQADHVEPVNRKYQWVRQPNGTSKAVATGEMWNPENDREDNLVPACTACNNDKHSSTLEGWRKRLEDLIGVCERNHSAYRHAARFGLIVPNPQPVVFYFERIAADQHPDCLEGPGRTPEQMAADHRELMRVAPRPADRFRLMFGQPPLSENPSSPPSPPVSHDHR